MARPRTPLLDLDRIGEAALKLVDETGDFTVPELARRLGVGQASLYHHVEGRSGIIELLRVRVGAEIDCTTLDHGPWEHALRAYARSYRAAFAAHPHVVPLLTSETVRAPSTLAAYERIVVLMEEAGFPLDTVMTALTALENSILGAALDLAAPELMWAIPGDVAAPRLAAALDAQPAGTSRADRGFEFGITIFIHGCRELLQSDATPLEGRSTE